MAKAEEPKKEAAEGAEAPPKSRRWIKKVVLILSVVLLVAGGVVGGMYLGTQRSAKAGEDGASTEDEISKDLSVAEGEEEKKEGGSAHGEKAAEGHGAEAAPAKESRRARTFDLGEIVANLQTAKGRQYVRTSMHLEAATVEARDNIEDNLAPLRDAAIMLLSSKRAEDLESPTGKERLKRELMARFEGILGPKVVDNIYIIDLMVQ